MHATPDMSITAKRARVHIGTSDLFGEIELAKPMPVPPQVARCPECNSPLMWQVTCEDPNLGGLVVDCKEQDKLPENMRRHRYWQAEWQPIINRVKAHVRRCASSPNVEMRDTPAANFNDRKNHDNTKR